MPDLKFSDLMPDWKLSDFIPSFFKKKDKEKKKKKKPIPEKNYVNSDRVPEYLFWIAFVSIVAFMSTLFYCSIRDIDNTHNANWIKDIVEDEVQNQPVAQRLQDGGVQCLNHQILSALILKLP